MLITSINRIFASKTANIGYFIMDNNLFYIVVGILAAILILLAGWFIYIRRENRKLDRKIRRHYDNIVSRKEEEKKK